MINRVVFLYLLPYGRFSNNVFSFMRLIQICKVLFIKKVVIQPGYLFMTKSFFYDDIHVIVSNNSALRALPLCLH